MVTRKFFMLVCLYSSLVFAKNEEQIIFTCNDFSEKIQGCDPYHCNITLAGITTVMEIIGANKTLCVVASTTGVTLPKLSEKGSKPTGTTSIPVTITCEYDRDGVNQLSNKFSAMKGGRYDFSSEESQIGEHNCITTVLGQSFPTPRGPTTKMVD